ncbi:MAG TPA: NAD(P)(+) transhydrogenase (Re/Si-specific) subunit beta [Gammaproteobacteria bacterium]|nr:NAD(P)(+) transhydrogenase (Re/Si-specific) subunit beta [Gammaproteobacteria bacterium]
MQNLIQTAYFLTIILFILGLKRMSSPATARSGITWAGVAMGLAVVVTMLWPDLHNIGLMLTAIFIGALAAWISGRRVAMTDMPQMVAIYNGMGGGAAAAIAAVELLRGELASTGLVALSVGGGLIGAVAFSGSMVAFAKLQGLISGRPITFPAQQPFNLVVLVVALLFGASLLAVESSTVLVLAFFLVALAFGVLMTLPIGGADMPVVISLFNALTGMAVGFEGFALGNAAMIVAGTVVGAAGTLLTQLMAKAMNRSLANVLFGGFGKVEEAGGGEIGGSLKPIEAEDAAIMMRYASKVIIVPGYGMAVAQAQHKIREMMDLLESQGVEVKFAIHPVAGRMPGHMNVLLAEAGVPYDHLYDLEEINAEFDSADVALVIGANDVVNPVARSEPSSPIYGMPILNVDHAENVLVIKRGKGAGFAGIENELFYKDNTRMLYGDAQSMVNELIQQLKQL